MQAVQGYLVHCFYEIFYLRQVSSLFFSNLNLEKIRAFSFMTDKSTFISTQVTLRDDSWINFSYRSNKHKSGEESCKKGDQLEDQHYRTVS